MGERSPKAGRRRTRAGLVGAAVVSGLAASVGTARAQPDAVQLKVRACDRSTRTGITVRKGEWLTFAVSRRWNDKRIAVTPPDGWGAAWWPITWISRHPGRKLFTLMACAEGACTPVNHGRRHAERPQTFTLRAPATGALTLHPNDLSRMYGNNWGAIDVSIARGTSAPPPPQPMPAPPLCEADPAYPG